MTSTRKLPPMGNRVGPMKKPKPIKFNPNWRRWCTESDAPVTLPKAPWETETTEDSK